MFARRVALTSLLCGLAPLVTACAPEEPLEIPENPAPRCDEHVCTVAEGAHLHTVVDARSVDDWIGVSLDGASEVPSDGAWDLLVQRYQIRTNGGDSGDAGVSVAILDDADFEALEQAPDGPWRTDSDELGENDEPQYVFSQEGGWYEYDLATHTLTPRAERVYVVKTAGGRYFKVQMDGYYDADGNAGYPSFTWSALAAP